MEKSADAFRTISEVAEELDLPQHVLRFWETRFTQIRPLKRGGGRRYYRPDDVDLLRAIRHLLYGEGYTIKGVQRLLKDLGARAVAQTPLQDMRLALHSSVTAGRVETDFEAEPVAGLQTARTAAPEVVPERRETEALRVHAAAPTMRHDWSRNDIDVLQSVLAELDECERLLAAARAA
jgi:DNA-binding transcriptional MerR regulator